MKTIIAFQIFILMFLFAIPVNAGGKEELKNYFNNVANKVKNTVNTLEKRTILSESFQDMNKVLDKIQNSGFISKEDLTGIDQFKASLLEKQYELEGSNGYERVADSQLNDFSNYVMQDLEQASITISLVAILLIAVLLVLLL